MGMTVVTFALILGIVRVTVQQNFIIMASNFTRRICMAAWRDFNISALTT